MIATGHYARVRDGELHEAANAEKDQTYFLYRVTEDALAKTVMPIGDIPTKEEVRKLAKDLGLVTADKKDSQGICFVGKVGIKDFLLHELGPQNAGDIVDQDGAVIGKHDGAIFYTIGQRHGLDVGGGLPYYVVGKDMKKNEVYVTTQLDDKRLWHKELKLADLHWINGEPEAGKMYQIRTRYRAALVDCTFVEGSKDRPLNLTVQLAEEIRAITPGQSAVVYDGARCLGGGIVI
jgi:tRNA-specific 2-thiouridylase